MHLTVHYHRHEFFLVEEPVVAKIVELEQEAQFLLKSPARATAQSVNKVFKVDATSFASIELLEQTLTPESLAMQYR